MEMPYPVSELFFSPSRGIQQDDIRIGKCSCMEELCILGGKIDEIAAEIPTGSSCTLTKPTIRGSGGSFVHATTCTLLVAYFRSR